MPEDAEGVTRPNARPDASRPYQAGRRPSRSGQVGGSSHGAHSGASSSSKTLKTKTRPRKGSAANPSHKRYKGAHAKKKRGLGWPAVVVLAVVAVLAAGGVAWTYVFRPNTEVGLRDKTTGLHIGESGLTVKEVIERSGLHPKSANLLAAKSRKVLKAGAVPPGVKVNGVDATMDTRVMPGGSVHLADAADITEPVVPVKAYIPVPAAQAVPTVISHMYKPGRAGQVDIMVGEESREETERKLVYPPMAAQRVQEKVIALTFDDGPSNYTPQILGVLKQKDVKATFCTIGNLAETNQAMLQRVVAEGHDLCNHTQNHDTSLPKREANKIKAEFKGGRDAIRKAGVDTPWYRPPGGALGASVQNEAYINGEQTIYWSVDTNDWRKPGPDAIAAAVHKQASPGGIVLMHDGGGDRTQTVAALPGIIDWLKSQGYTIVPMDWMYKQQSNQPAKYDPNSSAVETNPDVEYVRHKALPSSGGMAPTGSAADQLPGVGKAPTPVAPEPSTPGG